MRSHMVVRIWAREAVNKKVPSFLVRVRARPGLSCQNKGGILGAPGRQALCCSMGCSAIWHGVRPPPVRQGSRPLQRRLRRAKLRPTVSSVLMCDMPFEAMTTAIAFLTLSEPTSEMHAYTGFSVVLRMNVSLLFGAIKAMPPSRLAVVMLTSVWQLATLALLSWRDCAYELFWVSVVVSAISVVDVSRRMYRLCRASARLVRVCGPIWVASALGCSVFRNGGRADSSTAEADCRPHRGNSGQLAETWRTPADLGPNVTQCWAKATNIGHVFPESAKFGPNSNEWGPHSANFDLIGHGIGRVRPEVFLESTNILPEPVRNSPNWPGIDQNWRRIHQIWPDVSADLSRNQIGLSSAKFGQIRPTWARTLPSWHGVRSIGPNLAAVGPRLRPKLAQLRPNLWRFRPRLARYRSNLGHKRRRNHEIERAVGCTERAENYSENC